MRPEVRRIFAFLQEGILQGMFDEDKPLPSLRVLMERYGAPLHTIPGLAYSDFFRPFADWIKALFGGPAIPATVLSLFAGVLVSLLTPRDLTSEAERTAAVLAVQDE